jgi:hypothetical protein
MLKSEEERAKKPAPNMYSIIKVSNREPETITSYASLLPFAHRRRTRRSGCGGFNPSRCPQDERQEADSFQYLASI